MRWLWQRIHDIVTDVYPKERVLCILSFSIRLVCILAPALATWALLPPLTRFPLITTLIASYVAGFVGAFVYADLGPEELFRKVTLGHSFNPNIWPLGTLEGYTGAVSKAPVTWHGYTKPAIEWWQEYKKLRMAPWHGDPGSGRFGDE
jgi:hypothetical protein